MKKFNKISVKTIKFGVFSAIMVVSVQHAHAQTSRDIDLSKTMIENCDIDGNGFIYGRKDAQKNNIDMAVARKEFKCKMIYETAELDAKGKELDASIAAEIQRGKELDASIAAEKQKGKEIADRILKNLKEKQKNNK